MKNLTEQDFLEWANTHGLGLDEKYPEAAVLTFKPPLNQDRFWNVPPKPEIRPHFIALLLGLMGDWKSCYAWRHLGSWPESVDPLRLNDNIELQILKGVGLPLGTAHIVAFAREEMSQLVTVLFSTTIFGWSVGEDLYVVPDHALYIMKVSHHEVIHVSFRHSEDLLRFVEEMNRQGFPLPADVPDETFKRPAWMKKRRRIRDFFTG